MSRKEKAAIHRLLLDLGWKLRRSRGGAHIQLRSPDGQHLIHSSENASADKHSLRNFKAELRRCGVDLSDL